MTTDNFCFYLQNRLIRASQTGSQQYSDTSPFSIPCINLSFIYTFDVLLAKMPELTRVAYLPFLPSVMQRQLGTFIVVIVLTKESMQA
jgi:hypothetical protein